MKLLDNLNWSKLIWTKSREKGTKELNIFSLLIVTINSVQMRYSPQMASEKSEKSNYAQMHVYVNDSKLKSITFAVHFKNAI